MLNKNPVILLNMGWNVWSLDFLNWKLHFCIVDEDTLKDPNYRHSLTVTKMDFLTS